MAESKYTEVSTKVVHLDPERIKESQENRWEKELYDFMSALSKTEFELAKKLVHIICRRPDISAEPCEVIQFVKGV